MAGCFHNQTVFDPMRDLNRQYDLGKLSETTVGEDALDEIAVLPQLQTAFWNLSNVIWLQPAASSVAT